MSHQIRCTLVLFLFFPMFLIGQPTSPSTAANGNSVLTFTPASKIKKGHQTRFRKRYFGVLSGKDMELTLSEKKSGAQLELTVTLTALKARQTFKGTKIVTKRVQ